MVTRAALELEIDARRMKQGAAEAEKALVSVGETSKKTARAINLNTESIERKLDAIVDGIAQSNRILIQNQNTVTAVAKQAEQALARTEHAAGSFGREMNKTSGIAGIVEKRFMALGKAAVGMFAADVAAKVLGFNSTMDLLGKTTDFVAKKIQEAFGIDDRIAAIERHRNAVERTADSYKALADALDKIAKSGTSATQFGIQPEGANVAYRPPGGMYQLGLGRFSPQGRNFEIGNLDPGQAGIAKSLIEEMNGTYQRILSGNLDAEYKGGGILGGESFTGAGLTAAFDRLTQSIQDRIDAMSNSLSMTVGSDEWFAQRTGGSSLLGAGNTSLGPMRTGSDEWFAREAEIARRSYRPDMSGFYGENSDVSRRSRSAAEMLAQNARRDAALNTSQLASLSGYGGIPDNRWDFGMGYTGGGNYGGSQDTMPIAARNRRDAWLYGDDASRTDGGYIGALQNRYSPERIAEQFSANFYQSLEASVMTGDFSNFGRSVMQMIGQSLMESLVAAPIQEAMASLMQALLGGLRNGFGGGAAVGAGYTNSGQAVPPGAPLSMQSGGTSTSVAPYRSGKQRYDDLSRRNLR